MSWFRCNTQNIPRGKWYSGCILMLVNSKCQKRKIQRKSLCISNFFPELRKNWSTCTQYIFTFDFFFCMVFFLSLSLSLTIMNDAFFIIAYISISKVVSCHHHKFIYVPLLHKFFSMRQTRLMTGIGDKTPEQLKCCELRA